MEDRDIKLIEEISVKDAEVKQLWDDHVLYSKQVEKLEARASRTSVEEQTLKELKKQKLEGKTKLDELLTKYR